MKNLFLNFSSEKSRENGRFLMEYTDKMRIHSLESAKEELAIKTKKETMPLMKSAGVHPVIKNDLNNLSHEAKNSREKTTKIETNQKTVNIDETDPKKIEFTEKEKRKGLKFAKNTAKSFVKEKKTADEYKNFLDTCKNLTPEEFAEANKKFMDKRSADYMKYVEKSAMKHSYIKKHWKLLPNDWENTAKISTAMFALGAISHEGSTKESFLRGGNWALWGAVLTHPVVTGALAHSLKFLGKYAAKGVGIGFDWLTEFIYNPKGFLGKISEGKNPIPNEKLAKQLTISQSPRVLLGMGMNFSPELTVVLDFINKNPNPQSIPDNIRKNSAKFLFKTKGISKDIKKSELAEISTKIFNKEKVSDDDYRKILIMNGREEVETYFSLKKEFETDLNFSVKKIEKAQKNLSDTDKGKLKALGIKDLKQVVGMGINNFAEFSKEKKHGIRRALSNMSGTSLIAYILIFLMSKGAMGISGLWKKGAEISKPFREKSGKEKLKSIAGGIWKIPVAIWTVASYPVRLLLGKTPRQQARKHILAIGSDSSKGFGWTAEQQSAWKNYPRKKKKSITKKYLEKAKQKRTNFDEGMKVAKKIEDKTTKEKKIKVLNENKSFTKEEIKKLFSGDSEISKILFP